MRFIELKLDDRALAELQAELAAAGAKVQAAMTRAVNHVGNKAYTKVVRALQT